MKILLLTTHLRMGGVAIYVVTLAAALKKLGHEVFVVSSGGELARKLEKEGISHMGLDLNTKSELNPKLLPVLYHLYWLVKENGIKIVHTHTRVAQVLGEELSFLTGVSHISTCHGFFKPRIGRRLFGCWGKKVIAISDAVREHLVNDFKLNKSRVELIHNGIDMQTFEKVYSDEEKKMIKKEFALKEGPVVGIIARLSSVKGHKFLIKAMKKVVDNIKDAQLLIIGEGEEELALKLLAKELGLSGSIVFCKNLPDTSRPLAIMDVFALPSLKEGLGLVLLEALCCATPVVASDVGGIYSIVKDGLTGLLVPPRDPDSLASAILKLVGDRDYAQRLAKNGQKFVRENFSLDKMAKKADRVYKSLVIS